MLACTVGLRTGEIFLFDTNFVHYSNATFSWPLSLIGNGVKAGRHRKLLMPLAEHCITTLQLIGRNPFPTTVSREQLNSYLNGGISCTAQAARHVFANTVMHEERRIAYGYG